LLRRTDVHKKLILIAAGIFILTACKPAPPIQMNTGIKELMDSMIDPSGDFLFESVVEISDKDGIRLKAPRTDDEWKEVRRRAYVLYEGMNLVMMDGRPVALQGVKAENPQVELEPAEIQKLIDDDRPKFFKRAKRLQEAASMTLAAADEKDVMALFSAVQGVDKACENCHLHYWYPKDSRALEEAKKYGILEED
jgi:hypothetical protein